MSTLQTTNLKHPDSGSTNILFDSSGRVGLGNTSPGSQFFNDVVVGNGSNDRGITIHSGSGSRGILAFSDATSGTGRFDGYIAYDHATAAMKFHTNNADERLRISSAGHVLVGAPASFASGGIFNVQCDGNKTVSFNASQGELGNCASISARNDAGSSLVNFGMRANELLFATGSFEAFRIDASQRMLIGESSSIAVNGLDCALQVEGPTAATSRISVINRGNNAEGAGIQIAKSRGTIPHNVNTNDQVGGIFWCAGDGNDFASQAARIECFIDALPGGSDTPGRLLFSTTPDQTDSPLPRLRINSGGVMENGGGILADGTNGAGEKFTGGGFIGINNLTFDSAASCFRVRTGSPTMTNRMFIRNDGDLENSNNSYTAISDIKLKENIVDAASQWEDIKALQVRKYNFKESTGLGTHTQIGLVAQEVEEVSPGLVKERHDLDNNDQELGTVTKSVNYSVLYMKAVKALQEAMTRIEELEAKVAALEAG